MEAESEPRSLKQRLFNPYGLETRALVLYHVLIFSLTILSIDRIAAYRMQPATDSREVVLVSSQTCPHSRAVRARLVDAGIPFREVDSRENPVDAAFAAWTFQSFAVPIVIVGDEVIYGNRSERIDSSLEELGYPTGDSAQSDEG